MAEEFYPVPENPEYNAAAIRKIQDTDPVQASTIINPVVQQMISNTHAVKKQADQNDQNLRTMTTGAYNPEATYNAGAYCIHNGKLYKAQVNISEPEAWTESHWIVTSVGEELQELDAALSNKVTITGNNIAGLDCNNFISDGRYQCQGQVLNGPPWYPSSGYGHFFVDVYHHADSWIVQVAHAVDHIGSFIRHCIGGTWQKWEKIATTTPPQVYDLPLTNGFSAWGMCSYFKTQDSVVTLNVNVSNTLVTAGDEIVIGNLPEGFRPTNHVIAAAYCNHGNDLSSKPGYIFVNHLGEVKIRGDSDWTYGHASVTFFAP